MNEYPEHEKLKAVSKQSQTIGEFLEEVQNKGLSLCSYNTRRDEYEPDRTNIQDRLAWYFGIDLNVLEREKMAMLAEIRQANVVGASGS